MPVTDYVVPLRSVGLADIAIAGGKNASLGEMITHLHEMGIRIPDGFVITVNAYREFIEAGKLEAGIRSLLGEIDFDNIESLRRAGLRIRQLIRNSKFPPALSASIIEAYYTLSGQYDQSETDVAVRSSATAEDLPDASFAGQQETYLNVRGPAALMDSVRNCFASLFTDRAISYRENFRFDHFDIGLSVCIQKMVRSDLGTSGVAFSLDTETGFKDVVVINGSYGLGEMVVQGAVSPDEFIVFKPTLKTGFASIIEKRLGIKDKLMVYGDDPDERVKIIPADRLQQQRFCLEEPQILRLATWVCQIEDYYSTLKGHWCPMDVEWAVDGLTGELFIVQARPETIHSRKQPGKMTDYILSDKLRPAEPLLKGIAVGSKIGAGKVKIMHSLDRRLEAGMEFQTGDVLVTDMTDPDWEPIMKKAAAIITNKGGRTCHAAIVARELGVPAIVGCGNATQLLADGQLITASCAEGDEGFVYEGELEYTVVETDLTSLPHIDTPLMLNVGTPATAFNYAHLPHSGVGLAREEFIINNYIGVHPLALLKHRELKDKELTEAIRRKMTGFEKEEEYFISKLSYGIGRIAAAFYPQKVIVRFSDFKSNEYFHLLGGKYFEPQEENPMIGWRGAARYYSPEYKEAFGLECRAIRKVREEMGLDNVVVMIPFCRTVGELQKVQAVMAEFGLARGTAGLELFLMAEIPSNVLLAKEFAKHIDGFSIGSNDLTQLTLGLDRDSALVAHIYDERNEAVRALLRMLIRTAKECGVKVGICGQGPSDFPDFAQFLVEEGIDSISVTPDSMIRTIRAIAEVEGMEFSRK
ncbi:phosphoenolpyruvate synthase [Puia sp.]|uniref:phosphoenolpyruvate synthase n=1 Tax=Puia sp. TaxID=2045100 RepID=UPI002F41B816